MASRRFFHQLEPRSRADRKLARARCGDTVPGFHRRGTQIVGVQRAALHWANQALDTVDAPLREACRRADRKRHPCRLYRRSSPSCPDPSSCRGPSRRAGRNPGLHQVHHPAQAACGRRITRTRSGSVGCATAGVARSVPAMAMAAADIKNGFMASLHDGGIFATDLAACAGWSL